MWWSFEVNTHSSDEPVLVYREVLVSVAALIPTSLSATRIQISASLKARILSVGS